MAQRIELQCFVMYFTHMHHERSFSSTNALSCAVLSFFFAGNNGWNHNHLDMGSFVFDHAGVRLASDMGKWVLFCRHE